MWRAFQTAEAVSVGEVTSCPIPIDARCWLISDITCEARLPFAAGHDEPGVQSPVWIAAATGRGAVAAYAASRPAKTSAPTNAARRAEEGRLTVPGDPSRVGRLLNRPGSTAGVQTEMLRVTLCERLPLVPVIVIRDGARRCPTPLVVSVRIERRRGRVRREGEATSRAVGGWS